MTTPALQIISNGPDVEIRATVDDETHLVPVTPTEAYTLATFAEWLLDERDTDMPSTFNNLPDNVAVNLDTEPCNYCPEPHDRPILLVSVATGEGLSDVTVVELTHPGDLAALPLYLNRAAINATSKEQTHD